MKHQEFPGKFSKGLREKTRGRKDGCRDHDTDLEEQKEVERSRDLSVYLRRL